MYLGYFIQTNILQQCRNPFGLGMFTFLTDFFHPTKDRFITKDTKACYLITILWNMYRCKTWNETPSTRYRSRSKRNSTRRWCALPLCTSTYCRPFRWVNCTYCKPSRRVYPTSYRASREVYLTYCRPSMWVYRTYYRASREAYRSYYRASREVYRTYYRVSRDVYRTYYSTSREVYRTYCRPLKHFLKTQKGMMMRFRSLVPRTQAFTTVFQVRLKYKCVSWHSWVGPALKVYHSSSPFETFIGLTPIMHRYIYTW